jgi:hypothetical protein
MQWTIQMKDKQIAVISEKLNSHIVLLSSVEKEVASVKQVLGDVHCLVGEKENVGMAMITLDTWILQFSDHSISFSLLCFTASLIIMFPYRHLYWYFSC